MKTLEGFTDAPLKFAWKMKTWRGGGGIAKVINSYQGESL